MLFEGPAGQSLSKILQNYWEEFVSSVFRSDQVVECLEMARAYLTLYLDVVSPFAYLAFHVVQVSMSDSMVSINPLLWPSLHECGTWVLIRCLP